MGQSIASFCMWGEYGHTFLLEYIHTCIFLNFVYLDIQILAYWHTCVLADLHNYLLACFYKIPMSLLESLVEMKAPKICLNLTITNVSWTNMNPINAV